MDLGKIDHLNSLLTTMTVDRDAAVGDAVPFVAYSWAKYTKKRDDDLVIWHSGAYAKQFEMLRLIIAKQLDAIGHPSNSQSVNAALLAYTLGTRTTEAIRDLERTLKSTVSIDVSQFFLMPGSALFLVHDQKQTDPRKEIVGPVSMPPYHYGPLAGDLWETIKYRLERVGCSHFLDDLKSKFFGRIAIYRDPRRITALDLSSLGLTGRTPIELHLLNYYFDDLGETVFDLFWSEHLATQYHLVAAGADVLDRQRFEGLSGVAYLSIFLGFDSGPRKGTASLLIEETEQRNRAALHLFEHQMRIPSIQARFESEVTHHVGKGPFRVHSSLNTLARLMTRSREMASRKYVNEAFLLLAVALESVVGDARAVSRSTITRVAAVVALAENVPVENATKEMKTLYDRRSKFVHEARDIDPALLPRAECICRHLYFAAFRSQARSNCQSAEWKTRWLKTLDYLYSTLVAGAPIDPSFATEAGLPRDEAPSTPPS